MFVSDRSQSPARILRASRRHVSPKMALSCLGFAALVFLILAPLAPAQGGVSFSVVPYLALPGQPVLVILENRTQSTIYVPGHMPPWLVYNAKNELVFAPPALGVNTPVVPNGKYQWPWDQRDRNGAQVLPGSYQFRTSYTHTAYTYKLFAPFVVLPIPLTVTGTPSPGQSVRLNMMEFKAAGQIYRMGMSFRKTPGIFLPPDRVIPLNPDALFFLSMTVRKPLFENFVGTLDQNGQATARLNIPNVAALKGVMVYAAFTTFNPGAPHGILTVSNAASVYIK